jgi:DNA polymerase III subunit gamma/tau
MDNFVVSARKYRPQTFESVVGQESITNTLQSAIKNNHMAQAFLFCGPRGVGKTTCARILAREINADAARRKGEEVDADFSLNIFELDAASNNSVDDIRNLTEQVRFAPQVGTYRVYIIDEVHMLSQAAFNAFLKTLEEPPAHAIFILATTEKHKILPTILSRCQIFDFQRITVKDIANHLAYVAKSENVTAEPEALGVIAQKADGALRDALSMFDQLVSFAGNNLTYQSVIANLNVLDYDYYFRMTDFVMNHNIPESLLLYNEILDKGFDGHNFVHGFMQHLRNLMVCKNAHSLQLLETSESVKPRYQQQAADTSVRYIFKALEVLNNTDEHYKASKNQRLLVELCLMRLCAITTGTEKKNHSSEPEQLTKPVVVSSPVVASAPVVSKASEPEKAENTAPVIPEPEEINEPVTIEPKNEISEPEVQPEPIAAKAHVTPPVSPAKTEERKKTLTKYKSMSVSISAAMHEDAPVLEPASENKGEQETETPEPINQPSKHFDAEMLLQPWLVYAEKLKTQGRMNMYSTLTKRHPHIGENYSVTFQIDNAAQEIELAREKADFVEFLRNQLENFVMDVTFQITESDEQTGLYTNSKKFEAMVKKNPNLGKLTQNLNLDIF